MVYFVSENIISSLGFTTQENFNSLLKGEIGIRSIDDLSYYPEPFPASIINEQRLEKEFQELATKYSRSSNFTKLEKMLLLSVNDTLSKTEIDIASHRTAIVLSTTKGNIDLLEKEKSKEFETERVLLWKLGEIIGRFFNNPNEVIVLSNACISGVLAINTAAMLIKSNQYDNVVVTGGDILSKFVVSGFMSFLSLSPTACKPFDKNRDGLSLGEAAGTIVLSKFPSVGKQNIIFRGGSSANDANHISGPSRTAEGSFIAIKKAMKEAKLDSKEIDHISAHGTATPYNDEMESIAIERHGMQNIPVNSIKGSLGHTLGAAGIIETAILLEEMRQNTMLLTAGFQEIGVSKPINILNKNTKKELKTCLKMASGFGGSNAALIVSKIESSIP